DGTLQNALGVHPGREEADHRGVRRAHRVRQKNLWSQRVKAPLQLIVRHCDRVLRTADIGDYDGAVNGLQVANRGSVARIAATVDASLATVKLAVAAKAELLIVHHGL